MTKIDYYFTTLSPYTYLAGTSLEKMAERLGVGINYKPVDVLALFSRTGGISPRERHPNRQAYRRQDLVRRAKRAGLPLNPEPAFWPTNPAPSAYAIIAAQNAGDGDMGVLVHGLCRAVWAEDRNIAEDDVVRACLDAAGFDPALADSGMLEGAETYSRNLEEAVAAGVFGAPFYITEDDARFWGHDRLEDLEAHLKGEL